MEYKSSSGGSNIITKKADFQYANEEEKIVIEKFTTFYAQLIKFYKEKDLDGFNNISLRIFFMFTGKYSNIFAYAIEVEFVQFILDLFVEGDPMILRSVLQLTVGIFNCPNDSVARYVVDCEKFGETLNKYLHVEDPEILQFSLSIFGSLLYDCKKINLKLPFIPDIESLLNIPEVFPDLKETAIRTIAYLIDIIDDPELKGDLLNRSVKFVSDDVKLNSIFTSYRRAIIEKPELTDALTPEFILNSLIDIATPVMYGNDVLERNMRKENAMDALLLILTIIEKRPDAGEEILNRLPYDYLADISGKTDDQIAMIYSIINHAIPNRPWMFQLLIDYRVIFNLPTFLDHCVYKLRISAISLVNNLLVLAPESMFDDLFSKLFDTAFIEILIEFLQSEDLELESAVIVTIYNMFTCTPLKERHEVLSEFADDDVMDCLERFKENSDNEELVAKIDTIEEKIKVYFDDED